ncbi:MAG TPA: lytic transglycosylase domain-containing protein, partial [Acidimicrobiales bacterium]|nr:lytic transglycosylase domain-containing protein [Acidimicrobiales bacterium]
PGCDPGPPLTINGKGARGPMQFLGSTWRSSAGTMQLDVSGPPIPKGQESAGYATDGDDDGEADPWSWRDATHAAARYLLASGFKDDPRQAIYAYNNSWDYVDDVQAIAADLESKVTSLIDREDLEGGGGNGGGLALGCPSTPAGSTAKVPASHNTIATQQMANTLLSCFGRNGHDVGCYDPRYDANGNEGPFEHPRGRACDFMMTGGGVAAGNDRARGQAMAMFAAAHAKDLKIIYVIWYAKIWYPRNGNIPWERWGSYSCNGQASDCHYNHVHVSVHLQPGDPPLAHCPPRRCTE